MPFIRYQTGDLAVKSNDRCPCGRRHPLLAQINGREGDVIITPERNIVAPVAMDYAFYNLEEIKEGQVIQEDIKTLRVRVVPWDNLSVRTRNNLLEQVKSHLGSTTMQIILEEVEAIPRNNRGKRPFVISRVDYV